MSNNTNRYSESDKYKRDIFNGRVKIGSIIDLTHSSGNSESIRFHGLSNSLWVIKACNMSWDNLALEFYDLKNVTITKITESGE